ncbi:MAG: pilus assembly protein [Acidimicrobiia bacterium]|nr:pilus assembly protein [Acidimicrobiia bacterium]
MRNDRGAALVETALVLPFLVLLILGMVDLGRAIVTHVEIQDAAQEGAMFASFRPDNHSATIQRIQEVTDDPVIDPTQVTIVCAPGAGPGGEELVTVTVRHDLALITPIVGSWFGGTITLVGEETGTVFPAAVCDPTP